MKIAVCVKQVLDWEIPARDFRVDPAIRQPQAGLGKLLISIFDENALEMAVQLKERNGARVVAVALGGRPSEDGLRRALAMGADEALRVEAGEAGDLDPFGVAAALAGAIRRSGPVDLVLCGRTGADWDRGQVGPMLAEALGSPCVSFGARIEATGGRVRVHREVEDGWDIVETSLPAVVTVTNHETNVPRMPRTRDAMMAFRTRIPVLTLPDLGLDPGVLETRTCEVRDLFVPVAESRAELIPGDSGEAAAAELVGRLRARGVI